MGRGGVSAHGLAVLVEVVVAQARELGLKQVQWQAPPWNTDTIRFYDRLGAQAKEKLRYHLSVDSTPMVALPSAPECN